MLNWSNSDHILRFRKLKIRENQQILVIGQAAAPGTQCVITEPLPLAAGDSRCSVPGWLSPATVSAVIPLSLWGRVFHFVFPPARAEAADWQQEAAELVQSAARGPGPVPPWPSATYTQWLPDSEPSYIERQSRDNKLWLYFPSREKVNRRDMSCGGVWWLSSSEGRSVPGHGGQRAGLWPVSTMVRETRHLWVGNLPENLSKERIKEYFNR